jgi:hypothetical protein
VAQVATPALARADGQAPPPAERAQDYSPYERETIAEVLRSLHASEDPAPEGKTIERIDVVPLDVFEERDPLPRWLNALHTTTRSSVVRREMLLHEDEPYRQVLADDTLRDLRHLVQLSLVLVVAAKGTDNGKVRIVVITKDVWSLRLNWDLTASLTSFDDLTHLRGIENLTLEPSEENVAGVHHIASGLFVLDPSTATVGGGYEIPRIAGSRVALDADADVIFNRDSGAAEGSGAGLVVGQPIYSGLTDWSWETNVAYADLIERRFINAQPAAFLDTATGRTVPFAYNARSYAAVYQATRSFGWDVKHDVTFGADVSSSAFRPAFSADARTTADFVAAFVPTNDARIGPFFQYHTYTKRYVRLVDFESLILQEDAGLGHDVVVRAFPSFHALGSTYDVLAVYAAAQYSWALRDGFFRAAFASTTEPQPDHIGNAAITPSAHLVTPTVLGAARLVVDGMLLYRWRDELNIQGACPDLSTYSPFAPCTSFLGGSNRLRGFPTNFFVGRDFVSYNVEVRTRPVDVLTLEVAGTLFFDSGGAFNGLGNLQTFHSVGLGLRALFPWLDREVFSADIGFPLERPADATGTPVPPVGFLVSFGQAFDVPSVAPPSLLPTGQAAW